MKNKKLLILIGIFILTVSITLLIINKDIKYEEFKVLDDRLLEIYYDKYMDNYEMAINYLDSIYEGSNTGCSSIYKDGLLLRNLDWYIKENDEEVAELVIHTTNSENRYATVGVVSNQLATMDNYNNLSDSIKKIIPFIINDGINSEGLMYSQNVVPELDGISNTYGTNPDGENLSFYLLGRKILDNCANVDEAIELVKKYNIFMPDEGNGYRMESHIMIADSSRAVVIEFVDNKVVVLEQDDLPDKMTYMTNHYLYNGGTNTGHGMGYERDKIIKDNYENVSDWKTGMNLLKSLKYSNAYTLDVDDNFWYSEYYVKADINGTIHDFNKDTSTKDANFVYYINKAIERYNNGDGACWWTNHSSVYSSSEKTLYLVAHENYDKTYYFKVN